MENKLKISLLCGGPSLERGISLNSARSVCDHLNFEHIEILPIYFDHHKRAYQISRAQLYSNTPSDFDFKLQQTAKPLNKTTLHKLLKNSDLAFPVMHGAFGEDGEIQSLLEKHKIPYIGSTKKACQICFDKYKANKFIQEKGFFTIDSSVVKIYQSKEKIKNEISDFFKKHKVKRAIIKPATGGSSIGVYSVNNENEAFLAAQKIFSKRIDTMVVMEPFCTGIEFTVIILENPFGLPVAVLPTEMEMNYDKNQIFDYRKKYLSTNQVRYHCPPRFPDHIVEKIQIQAEQLFKVLGMRDFARFDGWLLDDGNIWFSDFNPISGMEQNSFLFMQSSQIGFSHRDLLKYIVKNACQRHKIEFPDFKVKSIKNKKRINVLFGGKTAERQVSVMSGTNIWLKLKNSGKYDANPYLLDLDDDTVWELPYSKTLNHTVEEIRETCIEAELNEERIIPLRNRVIEKLALKEHELSEKNFLPKKSNLKNFLENSEYVFIGLHGGIGENGEIQGVLEKLGVPFNGSSSKCSKICMDKYKTGEVLKGMEAEGIFIPPKKLYFTSELRKNKRSQFKKIWKSLKKELNSFEIIVKPKSDGCSAGIVKLTSSTDLENYIKYLDQGVSFIPENTFKNQAYPIEMPTETPNEIIFEQFIYTDKIRIIQNKLKWENLSGWIEITMGVLGKGKNIKALNPSLTVASGTVLSLEEKFQGGTGVNITPPPQPFVKKTAIKKARKRMDLIAKKLGINGYARIDAFMEINTGELKIIEVNSTPALTPSTVIFHQALEEKPMLYPLGLLEKIIENA